MIIYKGVNASGGSNYQQVPNPSQFKSREHQRIAYQTSDLQQTKLPQINQQASQQAAAAAASLGMRGLASPNHNKHKEQMLMMSNLVQNQEKKYNNMLS